MDSEQYTGIEVKHFNIGVTPESLRVQEGRLVAAGQRDEGATKVFQDYYLPNQEFIRDEGENQTRVVRALVDPEEYVIAVDKTGTGKTHLLQIVSEDQQSLATNWQKFGLGNTPPMSTSVEIIIGNMSVPQTCYRYHVLDAQPSSNDNEVVVTVEQNIEHEKGNGAYIPFGMQTGENTQPENVKEDKLDPDRIPSSMVVTSDEGFTDIQKELMKKDNLPPGIAFGRRTGNLIAHQRAPQGMTRYGDDVAKINLDLSKDDVWIVAVSGHAVEQLLKESSAKF